MFQSLFVYYYSFSPSIIVKTIIETCRIFLYDIDDLSNIVIIVEYSYTHCGICMWALSGRNFDCLGVFKMELAHI